MTSKGPVAAPTLWVVTDKILSSLLDDLAPLRRARSILLIGEIHGTEQFPRLVAELTRAAVAEQLPITVGLEIPCSEQERLDDLLQLGRQAQVHAQQTDAQDVDAQQVHAQQADAQDVAAEQVDAEQVEGWWWDRAREFQDGRSSRSMAELVSSLATLARQGADVAVVALDGPWVAPGSPIPLALLGSLEQDRDEGMAVRLLDAIDRRPRAFTVVLAGNEHTRVMPRSPAAGQGAGVSDSGAVRPMGSFVRAWHRDMVALNGCWSSGTAWIITTDQPEAGSRPLSDVDLPAGAQWTDRPGDDGHHGYVHVGPVTASAPHRVRE